MVSIRTHLQVEVQIENKEQGDNYWPKTWAITYHLVFLLCFKKIFLERDCRRKSWFSASLICFGNFLCIHHTVCSWLYSYSWLWNDHEHFLNIQLPTGKRKLRDIFLVKRFILIEFEQFKLSWMRVLLTFVLVKQS